MNSGNQGFHEVICGKGNNFVSHSNFNAHTVVLTQPR